MGNTSSNEIDQLKQLYSMNAFQLESLRKELINQKQINEKYRQIITNLQNTQHNIKHKIPNNQFSKVDTFLKNMDRDIQSKNSTIESWQPGQGHEHGQGQTPSQPNPINKFTHPKVKDYSQIKKSHNEINPYSLYGLTENQPFNLTDLKAKYREYAFKTHPDRNNGDSRNFNIVTNAYKFLLKEHSKMEKDKQFTELKNSSVSFIETQDKSGMVNTQLNNSAGKNFNLNRFNNVFSENKIDTADNEGYNDWLNNNKFDSEDIKQDVSITTGNFNSRFNAQIHPSQEIQKYQIPIELPSKTSNVQELGVDKIENYSGETPSIKYTDLKEAHTTSRLVDPKTKYKKYRNIGEIEAARSNMGDMTHEEKSMLERLENEKNKHEYQRESNQKRMDLMFTNHHNKMNQIFLGGR